MIFILTLFGVNVFWVLLYGMERKDRRELEAELDHSQELTRRAVEELRRMREATMLHQRKEGAE